MSFKVLVTGGRNFFDAPIVQSALDFILSEHPDLELWTGSCPHGADLIAEKWAKQSEVNYRGFPAKWNTHKPSKAAGPLRNQAMIDAGPDLVVAFPGGRGTADCVARAKKAGLPVLEVR